MRKIERALIQAIIERTNWKSGNTSVEVCDLANGSQTCIVKLHGNVIARYDDDGTLHVRNAGWKTATTKSRLNAILTCLGRHTYGVYQKQFNWYLIDADGEHDFNDSHWLCVA